MSTEQETVWYHGTRRGFGPGGFVTPTAFHGGSTTTAPVIPGKAVAPDSRSWVYMTTSLELAWVYAWHATGRGKPKVLVIRPTGRIEHDPEHGPDMPAYRCDDWCRVLRVLREPIVTEEEARNGWIHEEDYAAAIETAASRWGAP